MFFSLPFKSVNSIKNCIETTSAPCDSINFAQALIVPPVASKSSTIATLSPLFNIFLQISNLSVPYSREYSKEAVSPGNFPGFLTGINPTFKA